jgi:hypothetical protein
MVYLRSLEPDVFAVCSFSLDNCDIHLVSASQRSIVHQPSGQVILTWPGDYCHRHLVSVWELQTSGRYEVVRETKDIPDPISFSPNSRYLFYHPTCDFNYGIWDFETNRLVQVFEFYRRPYWLPDNKHFLTFNTLHKLTLDLYRIGEDQPLDTIDLNAIPGLGPVDSWVSPESLKIWNTSTDGSSVIVNLGHAAMVVGIDY